MYLVFILARLKCKFYILKTFQSSRTVHASAIRLQIKQKTCYEILGVSQHSSNVEIRAAYIALCLKFHPDRGSAGDLSQHTQFLEINQAYQTLISENTRKAYDVTLTQKQYSRSYYNIEHRQYYDGFTCAQPPPRPADPCVFRYALFVHFGYFMAFLAACGLYWQWEFDRKYRFFLAQFALDPSLLEITDSHDPHNNCERCRRDRLFNKLNIK